MHCVFKDIIKKLGMPKWSDHSGFPRYGEFSPKNVSNIYAGAVFLIEIACQACYRKMDVAVSFSIQRLCLNEQYRKIWDEIAKENNIPDGKLIFGKHWQDFFRKLSKDELLTMLHYGDPPRHDCSGAGETMSCIDLKIKECWIKNSETHKFERIEEFEIELEQL